MLKKIVKSICHKIFTVGRFEFLRIQNEANHQLLKAISVIDPTVWISSEASIINNSLPAERITIAANSRIMGQLFLFDIDGEIKIGDNCFVGPGTRIWSAKKISIGNRVLIAHNVNIIDNISHPLDAKLRFEENYDFVKTGKHGNIDIKASEIVIEDDVWIGFNSTILRGVHIGRGAIIGAGSTVTKDVEAWTVSIGNPCSVIKRLTPVDVVSN
jgi:acetyltransferase-like isoleucine patch superfamily enzyme